MQRRTFLHRSAALAALPLLRSVPAGATAHHASRAALRVNAARLNGWLAQFDAIGRTPTGINRVAYSEADLAGRTFTLDLFRQAGLAPRIDTAGNIFGRLEGTDRSLKPVLIGSHVDSVTANDKDQNSRWSPPRCRMPAAGAGRPAWNGWRSRCSRS
jgi:N-carbamoyl-L-amino-acid hydrolase